MKKILIAITVLFVSTSMFFAQTDTLYVMKSGVVIGKYNVINQVDSISFHYSNNSLGFQNAFIPAGTFIMGSPETEVGRWAEEETQHKVTLSAFRMSKYEITNTQYAAFLNAKGIGSNGLDPTGAYPTDTLIYAEKNWGVYYGRNGWIPAAEFENAPVVNVTWYGATEYAKYVGGTLPTEAQWEYACRAGTTTTFNTGDCLSMPKLLASYKWSVPYSTCNISNLPIPVKPQPGGNYPPNSFGLYDMHGNVWEWCSDWYEDFTATPQTNPTGPTIGKYRIGRGGSFNDEATWCRSALRSYWEPNTKGNLLGFRVVFPAN